MIIGIFLKVFLLTLAVECLVSYLMGFRGRLFYIILLLANLITNPLLNYILMVIDFLKLSQFRMLIEISLEIAVIIAEYKIFSYALHQDKKKLFHLSAAINCSSYLTGIILFRLLP